MKSAPCRTQGARKRSTFEKISFSIRTIPSVRESHPFGRCGRAARLRRLYCRWGIAPRPKEFQFTCIIFLPRRPVKRLNGKNSLFLFLPTPFFSYNTAKNFSDLRTDRKKGTACPAVPPFVLPEKIRNAPRPCPSFRSGRHRDRIPRPDRILPPSRRLPIWRRTLRRRSWS